MKLDAGLHGGLAGAGEAARQLEALGYDGLQTAEVAHECGLPVHALPVGITAILVTSGEHFAVAVKR